MKCAYIDCTPLGRSVLAPEILAKVPNLDIHVGDPDPQTLAGLMAGAAGVVNGHTVMDAALLERHPALRTIVFLGTGASTYIDLAAAERLGIKVLTVRGYGDRTIAEHALALALAGARNIARMDRAVRQDGWTLPVSTDLFGKRLGVVGTGGIGSALIRLAAGFGMEVVAWNRSGVPQDLPCAAVTLDALLETSHVVSLHLALNEGTRHLLDRARLERLRPDAILVNVARGALIDEAALIDLLQQGRIAHAALDVFEEEPLPAGHPLKRLDNVTLTSHAAFNSREAMVRLLSSGFDLLRAEMERMARQS